MNNVIPGSVAAAQARLRVLHRTDSSHTPSRVCPPGHETWGGIQGLCSVLEEARGDLKALKAPR